MYNDVYNDPTAAVTSEDTGIYIETGGKTKVEIN
jgi:hypothetical protein